MKKTLLLICFVLSVLLTEAQTYFKAGLTELYFYDNFTKEWTLHTKNSDVNITVVVEEEFITIQAKTPSMYKVYSYGKEPFNTTNLQGYRYNAKDLKRDEMIKIDILKQKNGDVGLISIVNMEQGFNQRYFLTQQF
jgi:hypothetical protein